MMALWREGTPEARGRIGEYCLQDTALPLGLAQHLDVFTTLFEMGNAAYVPVDYILQRGQTVRCYSMMVRAMGARAMICPDDFEVKEGDAEGKYEGATVIEPKRGAWFTPVVTLDYASLYPSIIRAHTLCPSSLVLDSAYAALDGYEYTDISIGEVTHRFARDSASVTPHLLQSLGELRGKAKRDMAAYKVAGDRQRAGLMDCKQKAIKVCMNSIYGLFGSATGYMPCKAVAASTTATGRAMIEKTREVVEARGATVVYGDTGTQSRCHLALLPTNCCSPDSPVLNALCRRLSFHHMGTCNNNAAGV